ncbi:MAG: hypothetical protein ACI86S_002614 [Paracoccaceae bacterium]|jgi:hypothetical protein
MHDNKPNVPTGHKSQPRHAEHNAYGTDKTPYSKRPSKAELLARMKANAEKAKKD